MLKKITVFFNKTLNLTLFIFLLFFYSGSLYAGTVTGAVKTGFLFNFFKFVEWPPGASEKGFRFCLAEESELGASIGAIDGKTVNGKVISVRRNVSGEALKNCSMIFLPFKRDLRNDILQQINGLPILTVGDGESFIDQGGMIGLIESGSHLGFEVNLLQLKQSRLQVSAQLLKLAKNVKGGK